MANTRISSETGIDKVKGRADGSNPAAGQLGEYIESTTLATSVLTNGVETTAISLYLQPGDWDVQGILTLTGASAAVSSWHVGVSTTVNDRNNSNSWIGSFTYTTGAYGDWKQSSPVVRFNLSIATGILLRCSAGYASGTLSIAAGKIRARRAA